MTEHQIRAWLLDYAWLGTEAEQASEVECIMHQGAWRYLGAHAEQIRTQSSGEDDLVTEGEGYALSTLYECHDGPHLPTCRAYTDALPVGQLS